jgi:hypothetical protein
VLLGLELAPVPFSAAPASAADFSLVAGLEGGEADVLVAAGLAPAAPASPAVSLVGISGAEPGGAEVDVPVAVGPGVAAPTLSLAAPASLELSPFVGLVAGDSEPSPPPCELVGDPSPLPHASAAHAPIATGSADRRENFMNASRRFTIDRDRTSSNGLSSCSASPFDERKHSFRTEKAKRMSRTREAFTAKVQWVLNHGLLPIGSCAVRSQRIRGTTAALAASRRSA